MNQSFLGVATMQEYARTAPTKAWQLTLQQIAAAPDNGSLGLVAAGPLEGLLLIAGPFTKEFDVPNRIVRTAGLPVPCVDEDWP